MEKSSETDNKKYRYFTLETKLKIIQEHELGIKNIQLAEKYNVHKSSVSRIIKNKADIVRQNNIVHKAGGNNRKRKRISKCDDSVFENSLFEWFKQKRSLGEPISGPLIKEKAIQLNKALNIERNFAASDGWLTRFKERHGIKCLNKKGKKHSADSFINVDKNATVSQDLSDNEILNIYGGIDIKVECPDMMEEDCNYNDNEDNVIPSTSDALKALSTILEWCKSKRNYITQEECALLTEIHYKAMRINMEESKML